MKLKKQNIQEPIVTENALKVLLNRYLKKNETTGAVEETPQEMYWRIASAIAEAEDEPQKEYYSHAFYELMATNKFMPNSPTIMNAGRRYGALSACQPGYARILTSSGYMTMKEIVEKFEGGEQVNVSNGFSAFVPVVAVKRSGKKDVYKISTNRRGRAFYATGDHLVYVGRMNHKQRLQFDFETVSSLNRGDKLKVGTHEMKFEQDETGDTTDAALVGWLSTDGGCYEYPQSRGAGTTFVAEIQTITENTLTKVSSLLQSKNIKYSVFHNDTVNVEKWSRIRSCDRKLKDFGTKYGLFTRGSGKAIPAAILRASWEEKRGFLRAAFEADGFVATNGGHEYIGFQSVSEMLVSGIRDLLDEFGIYSTLRKKEDPRDDRQDGYTLTISAYQDIKNFRERVGFLSDVKIQALASVKSRKHATHHLIVESVELVGNEEVYDIQTDGTYVTEGIVVHNCYVLPVPDSIEGIFETLKHVALIQKSGGGTGFSFSRLRPDGDVVGGSGGTTSGPLSFIDVYSAGTNAIQQGSFRRGANMGILRCDHPDIIEFIFAKSDLTRWTNYNVSVGMTDEWMENATQNKNKPAVVFNPHTKKKAYLQKTDGRRRSLPDYSSYDSHLRSGHDLENDGRFWTYGEILDLITYKAWENAEPGLFFVDTTNRYNQVPNLGEYEATNPCGEIPLLPYGSCNLGSINLGKYYDAAKNSVNVGELSNDVRLATRFLDNVVTVNKYPVQAIRDMADKERRLGLGVMGFADLLFKMGIRYGSEKSFQLADGLSSIIQTAALEASEDFVSKEGRAPYLAWDGSLPDQKGLPKRRNSHVTAIAPTGTISIIADCSGGIEPIFSLAFKRQVMKNNDGVPVVMEEIQKDFRQALERSGLSNEEISQVVEHCMTHGTIANCDLVSPKVKEVFVTARDVTPTEHVKMQAAWQKSVDNAVSKTINMPKEATQEDVRNAYILAWKTECKGITVYRDGSREMQPMALKEEKKVKEPEVQPKPVGDILPAVRVKQSSPFGNMHVTVTTHPETQRELEVFAQVGKAGEIPNGDLEAICRLISLYLRSEGNLDHVIEQLDGIGTSFQIPTPDGKAMSLGDSLAKALIKYKTSVGKAGPTTMDMSNHAGSPIRLQCPACKGITVVKAEGCTKCIDSACGWNAC